MDNQALPPDFTRKMRMVEEVFLPGGALSQHLPGYEFRQEQVDYALTSAKAILLNKHALTEAGTGCGKSFGTVAPAILLAHGKIVIVTQSNALLDQYFVKDLPMLQKILASYRPFTFEKAKGKGNFACRSKIDEYIADSGLGLLSGVDRTQHENLMSWLRDTQTGDRGEMDFLINDNLWNKVCCEDVCKKSGCAYYNNEKCFFQGARKRFKNADVIVTNYNLYLLDNYIGGFILGPHQIAIFDEGHSLNEIAQQTLGKEIKSRTMQGYLSYMHGQLQKNRIWPTDLKYEKTKTTIERLESALWKTLQIPKIQKKRLDELPEGIFPLAQSQAHDLYLAMVDIGKKVGRVNLSDNYNSTVHSDLVNGIKKKLEEHVTTLGSLFVLPGYEDALGAFADNWCTYLEIEDRGDNNPRASIYQRPVDVSPLLRGGIFSRSQQCNHADDDPDCNCLRTCIVTSATLSIEGSFDFAQRELGIDDPCTIIVGSPFNYKKQMSAYFPSMPDPTKVSPEEYIDAMADAHLEAIRATGGGVLSLFTSYGDMLKVYDRISEPGLLPRHIRIFKQGDKSRQALTDDFKEDIDSVLLATKSFWTGIDVPGEALRCVIINKMPFRVPTEPMYDAKCKLIEKRGGNAFKDYAVPIAIMDVLQGLGRLIRHRNDRGLLVWLDSRIFGKRYGKTVLASLPPHTVLHTLPTTLFTGASNSSPAHGIPDIPAVDADRELQLAGATTTGDIEL